MKNLVNQHSSLEKTLHNLAFQAWFPQISLSTLENIIFKKQLSSIKSKHPVFITALPRAGTTLLLELCVQSNEFVSHTYSDMPFLFTPLLWNRFSKLFKQTTTPQERVHNDGIMVNAASPESFEEIIWKAFWPSRYKKDCIKPWSKPSYPEFEKFLYDHLNKLILLKGNNSSSQARYISKNNLNIARIGYLKQVFPESIIIIPFRSPLQHASSLLRQHRNFLNIHQQDPFAHKYMADTGHYDFGKNLRPVDFNNWFSSKQGLDPNTLSFWLDYWISSYQYLLNKGQADATFFSYDLFCNDPTKGLQQLSKLIKIKDINTLIQAVNRIITPKPYQVDGNDIDSTLLAQAENLYKQLQNISIL